ncbi:unnamed protein product [Chrysoparadoxa australica]
MAWRQVRFGFLRSRKSLAFRHSTLQSASLALSVVACGLAASHLSSTPIMLQSKQPEDILKAAREDRVRAPYQSSAGARKEGVQRQRGLRILVIDGGGSKGIVAVTVLRKLEKLLQEELGDNDIHLADHFDLVAGTSVGGMIALGHAHSGVQLRHLEEFLLSGVVFKKRKGQPLPACLTKYFDSIEWGKYSGDDLLKMMEKVLKPRADAKHGGENYDEQELQLDEGSTGRQRRASERNVLQENAYESKRPRVFAVSNPYKTLRTMLFANYPADEYVREAVKDNEDVKPLLSSMVKPQYAARATSAAPTYFPVAEVKIPECHNKAHLFLDGGIVNNSPVSEAVTEAQMLFGYDRGIELVVSVGCGDEKSNVGNASETQDILDDSSSADVGWCNRTVQLKDTLESAVTNSEKEFQLAKRHLISNNPGMGDNVMYRLNPPMLREKAGKRESFKLELDESNPETLNDAKEVVEKWYDSEVTFKNKEVEDLRRDHMMQLQSLAKTLAKSEGSCERARREQFDKLKLPEIERLLSTALEHAKRLAPALAPWRGNGKDPRFTQEKGEELKWKRHFDDNIVPILNFLEHDELENICHNWPEAKQEGIGLARDIETLRYALWRGFLNPLLEAAYITEPYEESTCQESEDTRKKKKDTNKSFKEDMLNSVGFDNLLRILLVLLPLDRSNALQHMQIDRGNPNCPRGIAWVSKEHLKQLKHQAGHPELKIGRGHQRGSIDKLLVALCKELDGKVKKKQLGEVQQLTEPELPQWMGEEEYSESFGEFYKAWLNFLQKELRVKVS